MKEKLAYCWAMIQAFFMWFTVYIVIPAVISMIVAFLVALEFTFFVKALN